MSELRHLFDALADAVITASSDDVVLSVNRAAERLYGISGAAAIGRSIDDLFLVDGVPWSKHAGSQAFREHGNWRGTVRPSMPGGKTVVVSLSLSRIALPDDGTPIVVGISNELTDTSLVESERLNRMIAEMASDYIFHVSVEPDGRAIMDYASKSFAEITGRTLEQAATTDRWAEIVHPDDMGKVMAALARVITERQPVELECRSVVRGAERWTHLYARPEVADDARRTVGIIGAAKDVTERKRMEDERAKLQDQLQQAMKMEAIGRLAGGLAHDFNNLLTGIVGNVDLALMDVDPTAPLAATLREVNKAAHSAAALTHQLLAFSRKQIIEPKVLSLNDLVAELEKMLARIIGEDIALHFAPDPHLHPVRIDPGQFEQVIVNLAVNARDAMPRGGTLLIETANVELDEAYCASRRGVVAGTYALLAITDTGSGMTKEVKEHLFEPFFTTKPKGRGTGLGLATIYGAVTQAGGSVDVSSEVGKGTTFRIYLPRTSDSAGRWTRERWAQSMPVGTETVLLVEDEQIVRTLAERILSRLGYVVVSAGSGSEALMVAEKRTGHIDLVLTDVVMPGMSGRDLVERLSRLHPEMKVLYTSGYTADVIGNHGVLDEGQHFIGKPYTPQDLAKKLREVLDAKD